MTPKLPVCGTLLNVALAPAKKTTKYLNSTISLNVKLSRLDLLLHTVYQILLYEVIIQAQTIQHQNHNTQIILSCSCSTDFLVTATGHELAELIAA